MIVPQEIAAEQVNELVRLLDEEIALLERRCEQLSGLSAATLRRDDEAMDTVLADIEHAQGVQERTDAELQSLRRALAARLGWPIERTRLAQLVEQLDEPGKTEVDRRRDRIISLTQRLTRQHMATAVVVTECARANRMLLESLFPPTQDVTTYGAGGRGDCAGDRGLVDVES